LRRRAVEPDCEKKFVEADDGGGLIRNDLPAGSAAASSSTFERWFSADGVMARMGNANWIAANARLSAAPRSVCDNALLKTA
jgi:hypothetical protein